MSSPIRCILVDDEERASNALSALLQLECPDVHILERCKNVPEAVLAINKYQPNLVFLDIEMPEYNGFELLGFFRDIDFNIIFVSAYNEYAINAFEVSAVDYLLKPVDIDQLKNAVEKVRQKLRTNHVYEQLELLQKSIKGEPIPKLALPMSDGLHFINTQEILYFEADGAYTTIYLINQNKLVVSKKLKFFEIALTNNPAFFRTHRSNMINLHYLKKYNRGTNEIILENNAIVQLSRDKKHEFDQALKAIHKSV